MGLSKKRLELKLARQKKDWGNRPGNRAPKKLPQNFPDKMSCQTDGPIKTFKKRLK